MFWFSSAGWSCPFLRLGTETVAASDEVSGPDVKLTSDLSLDRHVSRVCVDLDRVKDISSGYGTTALCDSLVKQRRTEIVLLTYLSASTAFASSDGSDVHSTPTQRLR